MPSIKFFKNSTTGNWTLGALHKVPTGLFSMSVSDDGLSVSLINGKSAITGKITDFVKEDGSHYVDLLELDSATSPFFLSAQLTPEYIANNLTTAYAGKILDAMQGKILSEKFIDLKLQFTSLVSDLLGVIPFNSAAPTPNRSGYYKFYSAGVKPSWLEAFNGETSVDKNDMAVVIFNEGTYDYILVTNDGKVSFTDIVNDLTSGGFDKVLSAEQGKILDQKIDAFIAKTVYLTSNEYQILIDNELIDPEVEYNIFEG